MRFSYFLLFYEENVARKEVSVKTIMGFDGPLWRSGIRHTNAVLKLLRQRIENQGIHPKTLTTDRPAPYRAA
jgi:hypothetical protein